MMSTLILVEEDIFSNYAITLLKYFIAEGIACRHKIFFASEKNSKSFIENLPSITSTPYSAPSSSSSATQTHKEKNEPSLKIAWQYQKYLTDETSTMVRSATGNV
jgi:elongator complex protein 4